MRLREWLALRGLGYVHKRAAVLLDRYGITPAKAADRIEGLIATLAEYGCAPTLPTPGRVVQRYPQFVRRLQDAGAEIAVHGYDHVDLGVYPPTEACEQLVRAAQVFAHHGIEVYGFRCPYLSCTDDLLDVLPRGIFDYSSNKAIWWDVVSSTDADNVTTISDVLHRLYRPTSALDTVCTPWTRSSVVEIPVCLPDDLELHDGLRLGPEGMTQAWSQILHRTHRRGELFVLMFHPELAWRCQQPLMTVLHEATRLHPPVWIARLRDISNWWREKSSFAVAISHTPAGLHISFTCSERATILVRGLRTCGSEHARCPEPFVPGPCTCRPWSFGPVLRPPSVLGPEDQGYRTKCPRTQGTKGPGQVPKDQGPVEGWDGAYHQLRTKTLHVPAEPRPFVGLPANAPKQVISFLREQGYILDTGETAARCGTYIDAATLAGLTSEVELINYIEASPGPLVRYWRWPNGAKSAMCVTGDLDALTLLDYASRLFVR